MAVASAPMAAGRGASAMRRTLVEQLLLSPRRASRQQQVPQAEHPAAARLLPGRWRPSRGLRALHQGPQTQGLASSSGNQRSSRLPGTPHRSVALGLVGTTTWPGSLVPHDGQTRRGCVGWASCAAPPPEEAAPCSRAPCTSPSRWSAWAATSPARRSTSPQRQCLKAATLLQALLPCRWPHEPQAAPVGDNSSSGAALGTQGTQLQAARPSLAASRRIRVLPAIGRALQSRRRTSSSVRAPLGVVTHQDQWPRWQRSRSEQAHQCSSTR
mmetsp:Transcript_26851/g.62618  ORF Transcript_26851/g.62618 Transcript_26851/m.62618 type:complete len:270 (-) Transcript_26851:580-1389(-)